MPNFQKKKNTSNIKSTAKTNEQRMGQTSANGLTVPGNLKADASGKKRASFNVGKNTKDFKS